MSAPDSFDRLYDAARAEMEGTAKLSRSKPHDPAWSLEARLVYYLEPRADVLQPHDATMALGGIMQYALERGAFDAEAEYHWTMPDNGAFGEAARLLAIDVLTWKKKRDDEYAVKLHYGTWWRPHDVRMAQLYAMAVLPEPKKPKKYPKHKRTGYAAGQTALADYGGGGHSDAAREGAA